MGHPIVGDATYTDDTDSPRMMLHAWKLALPISLVPPKKLRARPAKLPRDGGEEAPRPGSDIPPTDLAFSSADPFEALMAPA